MHCVFINFAVVFMSSHRGVKYSTKTRKCLNFFKYFFNNIIRKKYFESILIYIYIYYIINKYKTRNVKVSKYFNKFTLVTQYYYCNYSIRCKRIKNDQTIILYT